MLLMVHLNIHEQLVRYVVPHVGRFIPFATHFGPHHLLHKDLCVVHTHDNNMQHQFQVCCKILGLEGEEYAILVQFLNGLK